MILIIKGRCGTSVVRGCRSKEERENLVRMRIRLSRVNIGLVNINHLCGARTFTLMSSRMKKNVHSLTTRRQSEKEPTECLLRI